MFVKLLIASLICNIGCNIIEDVEYEIENFVFQPRGLADVGVQLISWMFIVPGTKWCGVGDTANNYNDLGKYWEEDSCCRTHDHCQQTILPLHKKYGLVNTNFVRIKLHCNCDLQFYNCLNTVNSKFSTLIGSIYFNTIGTQCFKRERLIDQCTKYTTFPAIKCVEYAYEENESMMYQWFDVPNYNTN